MERLNSRSNKKENKMSVFERACANKLADNNKDALPIVYLVWQLNPKKRSKAVLWLLRRGIYGKYLVEFYRECKGSPLLFYDKVLSKTRGLMHTPLRVEDLN